MLADTSARQAWPSKLRMQLFEKLPGSNAYQAAWCASDRHSSWSALQIWIMHMQQRVPSAALPGGVEMVADLGSP